MSENYLPVVVGAAVVGDHVLHLLFSDGTVGDVDFSAEQWTGVLAPLNDSAYFAEVTVDPEAGTVDGTLGGANGDEPPLNGDTVDGDVSWEVVSGGCIQ